MTEHLLYLLSDIETTYQYLLRHTTDPFVVAYRAAVNVNRSQLWVREFGFDWVVLALDTDEAREIHAFMSRDFDGAGVTYMEMTNISGGVTEYQWSIQRPGSVISVEEDSEF